MFLTFFHELRAARVPATLKEYLMFLGTLEAGLAGQSVEEFYYLARAALVKDERHLDRFDTVFSRVFKGMTFVPEAAEAAIPEDWLRAVSGLHLSEEEKAQIQALGGWDRILEELRKRLAEQRERHAGGSKWIGTGGTSPFGAYGYNPAGVRIGQHESRHRRAVKVWDKREFRDLDGSNGLGSRNMKVALRRLRRFAREGAASVLDLDGTIQGTARKGYLDLRMVPERRNAVKVLMFFDAGGSMDAHVRSVEELFSAAGSEFKHLAYYYFHNCPYEFVWTGNCRRHTERIPTLDVLNTYPPDYKVFFVGDAAMSPYEITLPGGAIEHWNEDPGARWLSRITAAYRHCVWLNPLPPAEWDGFPSAALIRNLMEGRMFPLTLDGLDAAIRELMRG